MKLRADIIQKADGASVASLCVTQKNDYVDFRQRAEAGNIFMGNRVTEPHPIRSSTPERLSQIVMAIWTLLLRISFEQGQKPQSGVVKLDYEVNGAIMNSKLIAGVGRWGGG